MQGDDRSRGRGAGRERGVMSVFTIHSTETVHGVYVFEAESEQDARARFVAGDLPTPSAFETIGRVVRAVARYR